MKVAIYVRESGTRKYKPASPGGMYPSDVTFCLRYTQGGKRRWEQLAVGTYKEAHAVSLKRLSELITESCQEESLGTKIQQEPRASHSAPKARSDARKERVARRGIELLEGVTVGS